MDEMISLPYWLFLLLLAMTLILVLDRVLVPGARWYLRRRINRIIAEVNARLDIEIRPFQLTRKQALIGQLMVDEKVVDMIKLSAAEQNLPVEVIQRQALKFAEEIVPRFNAYVYFRFGYWLARKIGRLIYRVRVGFYDDGELAQIDNQSSVVFVMNHRSNMDYVLVSFLVADRAAISYAVGEWARVWLLQTLIKSMGAFFVRRNSRNPLYRRVLERYVNLATRAGVCQAVFLEGGLTRDGKLRDPKLGFLDYMLRDHHPGRDRDIVFIPVGINYDRVLEDKSLTRQLDDQVERRSRWFVIKTFISFFMRVLRMERKARWRRFGYASVNFGRPLSVRDYYQDKGVDLADMDSSQRFDQINRLASELMHRISSVVPVLPIALMAEVILNHRGTAKSALELKSEAMRRIEALRASGAPVKIDSSVFEPVLIAALESLTGRGFVRMQDNLYVAEETSITILAYYANSIEHWKPAKSAESGAA